MKVHQVAPDIFQCMDCGYSTTRLDNLWRHRRVHHMPRDNRRWILGPRVNIMSEPPFLTFVGELMGDTRFSIEMCAGYGGFSDAATDLGHKCVGVDNEVSGTRVAGVDLTVPWFGGWLTQMIRSGVLESLGGGLPCCSFSIARRGRKGMPRAVRSVDKPWGLDDSLLTPKEINYQNHFDSFLMLMVGLSVVSCCFVVSWYQVVLVLGFA